MNHHQLFIVKPALDSWNKRIGGNAHSAAGNINQQFKGVELHDFGKIICGKYVIKTARGHQHVAQHDQQKRLVM